MNKRLNRVEPCVAEARVLIAQLRGRLADQRHQPFVRVFTALADDDPALGLLAYYIWRRRQVVRKLSRSA